MKLATFIRRGQDNPGIGIVRGGQIYPSADPVLDMKSVIANWQDYEGQCETWLAGEAIDLAQVRLLAPIPNPGKVMALGLNYADHIAERGRETPKEQIWFAKMSNSVNGPFDPIMLPRASSMTDYEVELVVIVGKRAKRVAKADAKDVIFGYCVGNDVSIRDWQLKTAQWTLGKSGDTHAPFGPYITTAEEVGDPHSLNIKLHVNGEERQSSNTCHLIFDVFDQIAELSQVMTLEPGDVIFTGTPGGVGIAMEPPRFLAPGDVVRCEIAKLGAIEGVMISEADV